MGSLLLVPPPVFCPALAAAASTELLALEMADEAVRDADELAPDCDVILELSVAVELVEDAEDVLVAKEDAEERELDCDAVAVACEFEDLVKLSRTAVAAVKIW